MFDLVMLPVIAIAALFFTVSGIGIILCAVAGALVRNSYEHESAKLLGGIAAALIVTVTSIMLGVQIGSAPRDVDDAEPRYYAWMAPMVAWPIHFLLGLGASRLGLRATEALQARAERKRQQDDPSPPE